MPVLTVNINDKKDKKALKALKAVIEALGLNYDVDQDIIKEGEAVSIPLTEWDEIQKRLNTGNLYDDFSKSVKAIKSDIEGVATLKNARELLNKEQQEILTREAGYKSGRMPMFYIEEVKAYLNYKD